MSKIISLAEVVSMLNNMGYAYSIGIDYKITAIVVQILKHDHVIEGMLSFNNDNELLNVKYTLPRHFKHYVPAEIKDGHPMPDATFKDLMGSSIIG